MAWTLIDQLEIPYENAGIYVRTEAYLAANPTRPNVPNDSIVLIVP
jgi:hypothetical protein